MDALGKNGSHQIPGLSEFLRDYPHMAIRPSIGKHLRLKGWLAFVAHHEKVGEIQDSFALQIDVPKGFPKDLPKVTETEGRIPRNADYHVNADGTLCLGSPIALLIKLSKSPSLVGFTEQCLVPFLYAISNRLSTGGPMPFGELDHGLKGMLADYTRLFGLRQPEQASRALKLLGMKKRLANKFPCPCGCGSRLGRCKFNYRMRDLRRLASRNWFKSQITYLGVK